MTARIGVKLRADLQVSHQKREGADRAVIKDPHTLRFFELAWEDYEFARRIDAGATAGEIAVKWQRVLPELCVGHETSALEHRAERLCTAVRRLGLAETSGATGLREPATLSWNAWVLRWVRRISTPMFVRLRLFDPDEWLDAIVARFRPLFSHLALSFAAAFVFISALACLAHLGEMQFHPEWFRVWQNLIALYFGILALKVIHESGHALVCKALGGHVHEVGVQLLAFHPTFFVDVSDTWMWPDRRRRIAVAAAGFGAEMVAAAVLFWLWRLLAPGFTRDLCLNLMFIASVSAVFFNANPLMRYDGYHMLADYLREPQLRQKAFATIGQAIRRGFFGRHLVPLVVERRGWLFALYGTLSTAYLVWIAFAVGGFLRHMLAPFGLEAVGQVLLAAWLVSMALPLLGFIGGMVRDTTRVAPELRRRPIALGTALVAAGALLMFAPIPLRVERECVIEVSASGIVRASQPGLIGEILVGEGDLVRKDQPLVRLQNRGLTLAKTKADIEVGLARVAMLNAVGENRAERVQQSIRHFNEARATAAEAARRCAELELVSPCDGAVLTRRLDRQLGRLARAGDEVLAIADIAHRECILPLTEKEARRIKDRAAVTLHVRSFPEAKFAGRISAAPLRIKGDDLPRALTALAGGDVAVDATGKISSSEVTHVSHFQLDPADARLRPGMTGRARLECGRMRLGLWLLENALDAIHLEHRI